MRQLIAAIFEIGYDYVHDGYGYPIDDLTIQYCMDMLNRTIELRNDPERLEQAIRENKEEQDRMDAKYRAVNSGAQKEDKDSFVYVALDQKNSLYKIGFTADLATRESTLKKLNSDIEFKFVYPGRLSDEKALHRHFKNRNKWAYGEWFKLDQNDLSHIADYFTLNSK